jgi:hypothetical protein
VIDEPPSSGCDSKVDQGVEHTKVGWWWTGNATRGSTVRMVHRLAPGHDLPVASDAGRRSAD